MKKLMKRVFGVICALSLIATCLTGVSFAAERGGDYTVIYAENFESGTANHIEVKSPAKIDVVDASTISAEDTHGKVLEMSRTAQDEKMDAYCRINYYKNIMQNIYANCGNTLNPSKAEATISINVAELNSNSLGIAFYDRATGSTKSDTLIRFTKATESTPQSIKFYQTLPKNQTLEKASVDFNNQQWYQFRLLFDYDANTYSAYINDSSTPVVENIPFVGMDERLDSIGVTWESTDTANKIYVDDLKIAVLDNFRYKIYDNDFNMSMNKSGTAAQYAPANYELNYQPDNCIWNVSSNGCFTFQPNDVTKTAYAGNIDSDYSYFARTNMDSYKVKLLKVDFDISLNSLFNSNIGTYIRGDHKTGYGNSNVPLVVFNDDGTIGTRTTATSATYAADKWTHYTIYIDYSDNKYYVYNSEIGFVGRDSLVGTDYDMFTKIRFNISANTGADAAVSIDNIKYETTEAHYELQHDTDNINNGFNKVVNSFNPNQYSVGSVDIKNPLYQAYGTTAEIVNSTAYNHVAKITNSKTGSQIVFGLQNDSSEAAASKLVKVNVGMRREGATFIFIKLNDTVIMECPAGQGQQPYFKFKDESNVSTAVKAFDAGACSRNEITLYMNFLSRNYDAYVNNTYMGTFTIPSAITDCAKVTVTSGWDSGTDKSFYVDNMSVTSLACFTDEVMSVYKTRKDSSKKIVAAPAAGTYQLYEVQFSTLDDLLESVATKTITVTEDGLTDIAASLPSAGNDHYYKYFLWDGTLKPITEYVELR